MELHVSLGWDDWDVRSDALEEWIREQQKLKVLCMSGILIDRPLVVLESLRHLEDVTLTVLDRSDADMSILARLMADVAPGLKSIDLHFYQPNSEVNGLETTIVPWGFVAIQPFLRLNPITLRIKSPYPIVLRDEDIKSMGAAWKQIRELSLSPEAWAGEQPTVATSFSSLYSFARHLPTLLSLAHCFFGVVKRNDIIPSQVGPDLNESISLNVGTSPLGAGQVDEVRNIILEAFAGYDSVSVNWDEDSRYPERERAWYDVATSFS